MPIQASSLLKKEVRSCTTEEASVSSVHQRFKTCQPWLITLITLVTSELSKCHCIYWTPVRPLLYQRSCLESLFTFTRSTHTHHNSECRPLPITYQSLLSSHWLYIYIYIYAIHSSDLFIISHMHTPLLCGYYVGVQWHSMQSIYTTWPQQKVECWTNTYWLKVIWGKMQQTMQKPPLLTTRLRTVYTYR